MLVGVASLPPSLIPALWNIGILHHKKAKLRKLMRQSLSRLLEPRLKVLISSSFESTQTESIAIFIWAPCKTTPLGTLKNIKVHKWYYS